MARLLLGSFFNAVIVFAIWCVAKYVTFNDELILIIASAIAYPLASLASKYVVKWVGVL